MRAFSLSSPQLCVSNSFQVTRSYFKRADPFYDEQENHSLIGVANVFLESLFFDVKLQYAVPIINQKGEVGFFFTPLALQRTCPEVPGRRVCVTAASRQ